MASGGRRQRGTDRRRNPAGTGRRRRSAAEARRRILEAAEKRLVEGGPAAVRVQPLAHDLGITDAAIHHHFGSREGLVQALLRFAGRRLKQDAARAAARWEPGAFDVAELMELVGQTFGDRGYARLSAQLVLAGAPPRGSGMFLGVCEAIHAARLERARRRREAAPELEDTQFAVALLNALLWAEPLVGSAMRRSVGLPGDRDGARRQRAWLARLLEERLGG